MKRLNKSQVNNVIEDEIIEVIGEQSFAFCNDVVDDPESGKQKPLLDRDLKLKDLIQQKKQILIYNDFIQVYSTRRKPTDITQ